MWTVAGRIAPQGLPIRRREVDPSKTPVLAIGSAPRASATGMGEHAVTLHGVDPARVRPVHVRVDLQRQRVTLDGGGAEAARLVRVNGAPLLYDPVSARWTAFMGDAVRLPPPDLPHMRPYRLIQIDTALITLEMH
jgi:hypothetical protein